MDGIPIKTRAGIFLFNIAFTENTDDHDGGGCWGDSVNDDNDFGFDEI